MKSMKRKSVIFIISAMVFVTGMIMMIFGITAKAEAKEAPVPEVMNVTAGRGELCVWETVYANGGMYIVFSNRSGSDIEVVRIR